MLTIPSRTQIGIVRRISLKQIVGIAVLLGATACSPSSLVDTQSPSTVVDPATVKTATGAIALRTSALVQMMYTETAPQYTGGVIGESGMLTDELVCGLACQGEIDERQWNQGFGYADIHGARTKAHLAREALLAYASNAPNVPRAWQGELYALEGYSVLWFAELFCSGIPLTMVPLSGAPVPTRGFTTQELFAHAVTLFDSAATLGADSANYVNLARVGKGRALLGLGQFAAADSAVANVPQDFVYRLQSDSNGTTAGYNNFPWLIRGNVYFTLDHEGGTGLVWSADPRTGVVQVPAQPGYLWPAKYNVHNGQLDPTWAGTGVSIRLADGLEAQLIRAEAALARGGGAWLTILNGLRTTCVGSTPCAPVPGLTATTLAPLNDPGTDTARVNLLMRERAMWLYLTGHREGDLRRLVRIYHQDATTLWPAGPYIIPSFPSIGVYGNGNNGLLYGSATVFTPDASEQTNNHLYGGCYNQNP